MSLMIESMESRTLLSAAVVTADLEALSADSSTSKAELTADLAAAKTDLKALKADVAASQPTKAEKKVLNTFVKAEATDLAKYKGKASRIFTSADSVGKGLVSQLKGIELHPGNLGLERKIEKSVLKLQSIFSAAPVAAAEADANTAIADLDTKLNALAAAVPSTSADVTTTEGHLATDQAEITTQLTVTAAGITKLASDLGVA